MSKITLNNVGSLLDATTAATTINNNSAAIVSAYDNTLSRDGTSPNQMGASLDMNSNDILNVNTLTTKSLIAGDLQVHTAAWYVGAGAPSPSTGLINDMYLDNTTEDVYGPKTKFGWGSPSANIKGSKGDTGNTGPGVPVGGSTGQALTKVSNTDFNTTWSSVGNVFVSGTPASGQLAQWSSSSQIVGVSPPQHNYSTFTSSGTFTTPSNSTTSTIYHYKMIGGGGGGGGSNGSAACSGGGGSGAYAEGTFTGVAPSTAITVTIGANGSAGSNTGGNGGSGGNTSLGSPVSITAGGGAGGIGSTTDVSAGGIGGAITGTPNIASISGQHGFSGSRINNGSASANIISGGSGANSLLGLGGLGGQAGIFGGAQTAASGYGAGGAGAISSSAAGSAGAPGIVIIDWIL